MQLEDRFYKSTEVADLLGVSLRTLYRYMENGKFSLFIYQVVDTDLQNNNS